MRRIEQYRMGEYVLRATNTISPWELVKRVGERKGVGNYNQGDAEIYLGENDAPSIDADMPGEVRPRGERINVSKFSSSHARARHTRERALELWQSWRQPLNPARNAQTVDWNWTRQKKNPTRHNTKPRLMITIVN